MSEQTIELTPTRPYLARAIYEWICDNQLTPYLLVDATQPHTDVPQQFVKDGQIVLNIVPHAVHQLLISNDAITFSARFGGVSKDIYVPIQAVLGIYARENGQGLFFDPEEYANVAPVEDKLDSETQETSEPTKKKPTLSMAFDLVQYFAEQIKIQKPQLLNQYPANEKNKLIDEVNILTLGKLISLWRQDDNKIYHEIKTADPLYIQEVARHLTTSKNNKSVLKNAELEQSISEILALQLTELNQLDETGGFGQSGLKELILGQVEHLSGQAEDWVWSTNHLTELIGSKPVEQEELSLDATMKEFNQMVHQAQPHHEDLHVEEQPIETFIPGWSKVIAPLVALAILGYLYCMYTQLV